MTLAELAVTVAVLGVLGLVARRIGLSAIPAYLLAGLLLGPNEPEQLALIRPSEVTEFVAELGIVFLLFFLGLEFTLTRLRGSGRHLGLGGTVDLAANLGLGLVVGVAAFGFTFAALILAACVYVSSSAIAVKGLIDFRRLGDDETDLVLAILVFEDIVVAFMLGFAAAGGGDVSETLVLVAKALGFITAGLAASRWLSRPIDRALDRLPLEFFLLAVFGFLIGSAAVAKELGLSEAIGALMAGIVLGDLRPRPDRGAVLQLPRHLRRALLLRFRALDRSQRDRRRRLARRARRRAHARREVAAAWSPGGSEASLVVRASTPEWRWWRTASSRSSSPRSHQKTHCSSRPSARSSSPSPACTCWRRQRWGSC